MEDTKIYAADQGRLLGRSLAFVSIRPYTIYSI